MDTKQKIEYIRNACIKANPKILDLDFGCEISHCDVKTTIVKMISNEPFCCSFYHSSYNRDSIAPIGAFDIPKEEITILGRKIGLADVLVAILHSRYAVDTELSWGASESLVVRSEIDLGDDNGFMAWNLLNDDLNNQSEECIDFLYQLLTKPQ